MTTITHIRNPLAPALGLREMDVAPGVVLTRAIAEAGWHLPPSTFLFRRDFELLDIDWARAKHSDVFVPRREWDAAVLDGDYVLVTLPRGGGGQGGSNVGAMAAMIGLMILAIAVPGLGAGAAVGGMLGLTGTTAVTVGSGIVASAIMIGGQMLLSALLPQPKQKQQPVASPTYSLGAQSNQARLGAAVPEWFGLYNVVPDLRAQPYINYAGGDGGQEYVHELFCIGKGAYEIEQLRIGTTVFAEMVDGVLQSTNKYPEIEWQIAGPEEKLDLFGDNVVTSSEVSGIQIPGTNEDEWGFTAYFAVCPPGTRTNLILVDISCPGGLYHTTNDGNINRAEIDFQVYAQAIDDNGNTTGIQFVLIDAVLERATIDTLRISYRAKVTRGRYQVKMIRRNAKAITTSTSDTLVWLSLRAFLPSDNDYGDCTMLAVLAQATKNLNGTSSDEFNAIVTRELVTPVKVGGVWQWSATPQPTRSIGAAAYYLLTSSNNADLDPSRIDGDWLLATEETWQSRGDTFDGGFDNQASFWDMLNQVLNVGRTQALPGPLISFVRDEQKTVYRCAFTPRQMVRDTFTINYVFFDQNNADAANVTYMDETNWRTNTVFCALPGSTLTADTAPQVTAFGMVSRDQVYRTWMYNLAASCYRREFPQFDTELDGRVCQRGDLVRLSHVMPQWGAAADVIALEEQAGAQDILTLSEPWTLDTDTPTIQLTSPDGYPTNAASVAILDDGATTKRAIVQITGECHPNEGLFADTPPRDWGLWGDTVRGLERERPKCLMGTAVTSAIDALVVSMKPQSGLAATVACVVDNPAVYNADTGPTPPPADYPDNDAVEDLQITGMSVREVPHAPGVSTNDASASMVTLTIAGAPDALSFDYRTKFRDQNVWASIANFTGNSVSFRSGRGAISVQVRGVGASSIGYWKQTEIDVDGHIEVINANFDFSQRANSGNYSVLSAGFWN